MSYLHLKCLHTQDLGLVALDPALLHLSVMKNTWLEVVSLGHHQAE
jgi:hypothetical protein